MHVKAKAISFCGDMSETESRSNENSNDIKLFGRSIPLLQTQIEAITCKNFQVPPKSQFMDSCSELTKAEADGPCAENSVRAGTSSICKEEEKSRMQVNEARVNAKTNSKQAENRILEQEKDFQKPDKALLQKLPKILDSWGNNEKCSCGCWATKEQAFCFPIPSEIVSSDGVPSTRLETTDSINHQLLSCGKSSSTFGLPDRAGTVLKFGHEAPLCESMDTVVNLRDPRTCVEIGSVSGRESGDEPSCVSSMTACGNQGTELPKNILQRDGIGLQGSCSESNISHPLNYYPVAPLVFPWNPGWRNAASPAAPQHSQSICVPNCTAPNQVQWYPTPVLVVPGPCPQSIPLQNVPAPYWGCMPICPAGMGNVSLSGSNGCLSPSSSTSNSCCSGNGSLTLGKHSRDSNIMDEEKSENRVLVPKPLRVDEASKSPIWASLGIKRDLKT
ncbi:cyclic dof factor 2-like isoform X1 [Prunus yedoensis var. nudiflora]|uniref:Cyclic dof factor 2-like isoform X1 n=1 Tax=Prunus yedoensis var. nudiflora TaxID=2094558 RepID=A0A314Y583_PRUYE|nr:cyclic dof factor 2-like isoform X1 [Prunus yedoensis var. nudiflora]